LLTAKNADAEDFCVAEAATLASIVAHRTARAILDMVQPKDKRKVPPHQLISRADVVGQRPLF
jgi:hypothetical protein